MKNSFEAFGLRWSRTKERGATAVVIALCLFLVMAAAAMSFDVGNLALQRQTLQNVTDAAAQAGAVYLRDNPKDLVGAQNAAYNFAHDADSTFTLTDVTLYCIVPSTGGTNPAIDFSYIPSVCDPIDYTGKKCDANLCSIPITIPSSAAANAIQVKHSEDVKFYFAPAIGIPNGNTGAVASVSCANSCGSGGTPNPLDVAIIADRTPSMTDKDFDAMKAGIEGSLALMTPEYQLVTLGTIHRSNATAADPCKTSLGNAVSAVNTKVSSNPSVYKTIYPIGGARAGSWMPVGFSDSYLTGTLGSQGRSLITSTGLGYQVDCMNHYYKTNSSGYPWGTHLAAPLKAAARLLLGKDASNLSQLSADRLVEHPEIKNLPVKQWIIFETDGYPEETMGLKSGYYYDSTPPTNADASATSLDTATEPSAASDTSQACQNFKNVATNAKAAGIGVIMIAYGSATTSACGNKGTVASVMASAASDANGKASTADKSCTSVNGTPAAENTDKDYFFCAATAADLEYVFKTAIGMTTSPNTKFVKLP